MLLKILTTLSLIGFSLGALAQEPNEVARLQNKATQMLGQQETLTNEINELDRQASLLEEQVEFSHQYLSGELSFEYKMKVVVLERLKPVVKELQDLVKANSESGYRLYFTKLNIEILNLQVKANLIREQRAENAKEIEKIKKQILAAQ